MDRCSVLWSWMLRIRYRDIDSDTLPCLWKRLSRMVSKSGPPPAASFTSTTASWSYSPSTGPERAGALGAGGSWRRDGGAGGPDGMFSTNGPACIGGAGGLSLVQPLPRMSNSRWSRRQCPSSNGQRVRQECSAPHALRSPVGAGRAGTAAQYADQGDAQQGRFSFRPPRSTWRIYCAATAMVR